MARDEFSSAKKHWEHWVVYATITFLSFFVFAEFALSLSFLSILSPSTLMFYFTPAGFFFGEALVSLFASVLLFLGLFIILRRKVYVKNEGNLRFNQSESHFLLPFYLISLVSLGFYISFIPLELSNILTYIVFLILFESFIEHIQVSDYGFKILEIFKKPTSKTSESPTDSKGIKKTLDELERITEIHEEKQIKKESKKETQITDEDFEQIMDDLHDIVGEKEDADEKDLDRKRSIEELTRISGVGRKRAIHLYDHGLKTPQGIVDKGLENLAGVEQIGTKIAKKILDNAKKLQESEKEKEEKDELEAELEELEQLLLKDE